MSKSKKIYIAMAVLAAYTIIATLAYLPNAAPHISQTGEILYSLIIAFSVLALAVLIVIAIFKRKWLMILFAALLIALMICFSNLLSDKTDCPECNISHAPLPRSPSASPPFSELDFFT